MEILVIILASLLAASIAVNLNQWLSYRSAKKDLIFFKERTSVLTNQNLHLTTDVDTAKKNMEFLKTENVRQIERHKRELDSLKASAENTKVTQEAAKVTPKSKENTKKDLEEELAEKGESRPAPKAKRQYKKKTSR